MSEPDPVFEPGINDAREALRVKLGQLLRDAEAIDAALYDLYAKVWDIDDDFIPAVSRISRAADYLGSAVNKLKAKLANLD
jgi:hypothetical protein